MERWRDEGSGVHNVELTTNQYKVCFLKSVCSSVLCPAYVGQRGQRLTGGSQFSPYGFQGLKLGHPAWQLAPLPAKLSCSLPPYFLRKGPSVVWSLPSKLCWLASEPRHQQSLPPQLWDYRHTAGRTCIFTWVLGSELRPPNLNSKESCPGSHLSTLFLFLSLLGTNQRLSL